MACTASLSDFSFKKLLFKLVLMLKRVFTRNYTLQISFKTLIYLSNHCNRLNLRKVMTFFNFWVLVLTPRAWQKRLVYIRKKSLKLIMLIWSYVLIVIVCQSLLTCYWDSLIVVVHVYHSLFCWADYSCWLSWLLLSMCVEVCCVELIAAVLNVSWMIQVVEVIVRRAL